MEEYTHLCVFLRDFPVFAANEDFITSVGESNHNLQKKYHMYISQCILVHSKTTSTVQLYLVVPFTLQYIVPSKCFQ
jgi:hypothetical protein